MSSNKKPSKQNHTEKTPNIKTEDDVGSSSSTPRKPTEVPEITINSTELTNENDRTSENINKEQEEEEKPKMLANMEQPQEKHSHHFKVKFNNANDIENVTCRKWCTVLEAIKSHLPDEFSKMKTCADENIIIEIGQENKQCTVATHFPCYLVDKGELLTISHNSKPVEEVKKQNVRTVQPKDNYSVFYIDTIGGKNAKTKTLFLNNVLKDFKFICVYGEKEMTVKAALEMDGRFRDLGNFKLSDNATKNSKFNSKALVEDVHKKELKICLPRQESRNKIEENNLKKNEQEKQQEQAAATENSQITQKERTILEIPHNSRKSVKKILDEEDNTDERERIYEILRQQFPELKKWMESRFPSDSYEKTLKLKQEEFGKIQQSFSEVHRIKKLLVMGKSVCKINVYNTCQGTGFVLFDRFVMTSAHLFKGCGVQGKKLPDQINVSALFNYDEPEPETNYFYFSAEKTLIDIDEELDFAVLELNSDAKTSNQTNEDKIELPPGLLDRFGPLPGNGEACLIGHPAGSLKKIDPTCIIEPKKREQAVKDHLSKYKDCKFILQSVNNEIKNQGIDDIMMGGEKAEQVATYNTFMYHGASGSPVFDAHGQIFGIHTGGYTYELLNIKDSVIEYAHPLLTIFEKFVINLKKSGNNQMLEKVKEAVTENEYLEKILQVEPMEVD